jgi:hypothetical protein
MKLLPSLPVGSFFSHPSFQLWNKPLLPSLLVRSPIVFAPKHF